LVYLLPLTTFLKPSLLTRGTGFYLVHGDDHLYSYGHYELGGEHAVPLSRVFDHGGELCIPITMTVTLVILTPMMYLLWLKVTTGGPKSLAAMKYAAFKLQYQMKKMKDCQTDTASILDTQRLALKRVEGLSRCAENQLNELNAALCPASQPLHPGPVTASRRADDSYGTETDIHHSSTVPP
jgi:hypothetical protein